MDIREDEIERAINLIVQSCSEEGPIIDNFDALFEIAKGPDSEYSPLIAEIARGRGLDMKYLCDGAGFLISRLYFSNDYYKILGLRPNATPSDIKKRWRDLIELYHPDRYGNTEWTTERAKRVNEAYSILKDDIKRKEYDERPLGGLKVKELRPKTLRAKKRVSSREFFIFGIPFSELRPKIPRYITAFYIAASFLFLLFIFLKYYPIDSEPPKITIQPKVDERETPQKEITPIFHDLSSERSVVSEGNPSEPTRNEKENPFPSPPLSGDGRLRGSVKGVKNSLKQIRGEGPPPMDSNPPSPLFTRPLKGSDGDKGGEGGSSPEFPSGKEVPTPSPMDSNPILPLLTKPLDESIIDKGGERGSVPEFPSGKEVPTKGIEDSIRVASATEDERHSRAETILSKVPTPEEVKVFISDYIATYEKGNIEHFMTLFSRSAIENDTIDYNGIHHIYARTFGGRKNKYQITSLEIRPMEDYTFVSGIYYIENLTLSTGQEIKVRGKINWRLIKEDGEIKILRANYKGF